MAQYWLLDWVEREGVADVEVACGVLKTKEGFGRFLAAAEVALEQTAWPDHHANTMVTSGALTLSGRQSCSAQECLLKTVDQLVLNTWHYFDRVVVTGLDPRRVLEKHNDGGKRHEIVDDVRAHIAVALYVEDIGATDLLYFQRPVALCVDHLNQHAREAGLTSAFGAEKELAKALLKGYDLTFEELSRDEYLAVFHHPSLDYLTTSRLIRLPENKQVVGPPEEKDVAHDVAHSEARNLIASFVGNAALAQSTKATLGLMTSINSRVLTPGRRGIMTPGDVALRLSLPIMEGIQSKELLRLRDDGADEFEVFRRALKVAIGEQISAFPHDDSAQVAEAVRNDVVNPALAGISRKVTTSSRLFRSRSEASVLIGGLVTTIGLFACAPIVVPGIVLAIGGVTAGVTDFLKERREVEMSDLHFLWQVSDSAAGRH